MPVKIFIGRDIQDHTQLPGFSHEARGFREIYLEIWRKLHWHPAFYVVLANPQRTFTGLEVSPDMIIISQLGLGVVELKHYFGQIDCRQAKGEWRAGNMVIKAGASRASGHASHKNPHDQVQDYASQIRGDLLDSAEWWLPGTPETWDRFKFHTAVCFTHPNAHLDRCRKVLASRYRPGHELFEWERFAVLGVDDMVAWITELRFEASQGHADWFNPYAWTPDGVIRMATKFFGAREWKEISSILPIEEPYAYLMLMEHREPVQIFELYGDEAIIGRDAYQCQIVIPSRYESVSRQHARISREGPTVFVEDLQSKYGTFLGGQLVNKRIALRPGQEFALGPEGAKGCTLRFSRTLYQSPPTT